jgi:poly-beta-hydroxyalkanoate depolymerase
MSEETPATAQATVDDATRDAVALVASLRKNDTDSASLLLGFYSEAAEQAALCASLAALACACLATIDNVRDRFQVTDGLILPSGDEVLKTVALRLAKS